MAKRTTRGSQGFPTSSVLSIEALKRKSPVPKSAYVSLRELAAELGISDVERLRPLIDHHYLRMLEAHEYLPDCLVGRPGPGAIKWLKGMLQPISLRPFLPVEMAARLMETNVATLRSLALSHNIQLYDDPAFGELLSIRQFHRLFDKLHDSQDGMIRFDRQAMITMLRRIESPPQVFRTKPLPYSKRVEQELIRIGNLREPDRTLRAVAFWEAYQDASTIKECLLRYRELTAGEEPEIEERLAKLMQKCVGEAPVNDPTR
jgi:hypothetical protein